MVKILETSIVMKSLGKQEHRFNLGLVFSYAAGVLYRTEVSINQLSDCIACLTENVKTRACSVAIRGRPVDA